MTDRLRITLLGTGSSGGVPRLGNDWGQCDPNEPKNRRRRCAILVERISEAGERPTRLLIDTPPDLREQLLDAGVGELDAVAFTHDHADQTHGIDDVRPIVIRMRKALKAYLDEETGRTLVSKFQYCFEGQGAYPPILDLQPTLKPGLGFSVDGPAGPITGMPVQLTHGAIGCLGFRFGGVAYCNDVSAIPEASRDALKDLDLLIVDALRRTPHPSHAHLDRALQWIDELAPKRAFLTNLHVDMDYATLCRELPSHIRPAYDGMTLDADALFPIM